MKTALLISYHWPPGGGAGVYRWLQMNRYLHEFGWRLIVYTPENPTFPVRDESLLAQVPPQTKVLRRPIHEPHAWYRRLTGRGRGEPVYSDLISESGRRSLIERTAIWIRGNLFIPDPRRGWIRPSVKYLARLLEGTSIDALVSTGPPHSMHLIALALTRRNGMPWVADFRDPWTGIDYVDELGLTRWAANRHLHLERKVLAAASSVVTVSQHWAEDLRCLGRRPVQVISNGFDPGDFAEPAPPLDNGFTIRHVGSMHRSRNPLALWRALRELAAEGHPLGRRLRVELIGPVDHSVLRSAAEHGLQGSVANTPYLRHPEAIARIRASQVLLLPVNDTKNSLGVVPGKLFEYLGARRPVLVLGPVNGDAARIVLETGAGSVADYDEADKVTALLRAWYTDWENNCLGVPDADPAPYSRRELARQYAVLLNSLTLPRGS